MYMDFARGLIIALLREDDDKKKGQIVSELFGYFDTIESELRAKDFEIKESRNEKLREIIRRGNARRKAEAKEEES